MEATLEPRLVMKGEDGKPFVSGEFFVAAYQRGYRCGRNEVRQLLNDIQTNAREAKARRALPDDYHLQPIVVLDRKDGTWELVDGQQRLTTLFLITKFISTKLPDARVDYWLTYETRKKSREYLETLDPARRNENIDFHHIAQAYDAIVEWFGEQANASQAAIDIHTALSEWVYVIWYQAPDGTNPNELFTRLNRDRIPLTDSELIKALVLSNSGVAKGQPNRQQEIAAQWDSFERDLRDEKVWAFLTRSTARRPTHIDFLFETLTPFSGLHGRPRYWTFGEVHKDVQHRGAAAFWRDVVERHGLLTGWYCDRVLFHRIGYLVQIGDSISDLIHSSRSQSHSAFRNSLVDRIRQRLRLTENEVSLLRYDNPKDSGKCTEVLLLMNVETVLGSRDTGSRFSFHAYADEGWSLEHIHAQNSQGLKKENERRDWLTVHAEKIEATKWPSELQAEADAVTERMSAHLKLPINKTDDLDFESILDRTFALFGESQDVHRLANLALLQKDINSKLNNAVFALKRERILELDPSGAYILPCTRNVFLKYYTASADQQLSVWSPQDQDCYLERLVEVLREREFLLPDPVATPEVAA
jgi:Protein of unknown function DUF262/Protein of unknown function (DUF1524)